MCVCVKLFLKKVSYLACFFINRFGCKAVVNIVELSASHTINYLINELFQENYLKSGNPKWCYRF